MKYIVIKVTDHIAVGPMIQEIPIIFPDLLVHSEVSKAIIRMIRSEVPDGRRREVETISAGFFSSLDIGKDKVYCHGLSESLGGLKSRPLEDSTLISTFDYLHGVKW